MKTPTDEQLNFALHKWLGWKVVYYETHDGQGKNHSMQSRPLLPTDNIPNYLSDDSPRRLLNEAEAKLRGTPQFDAYLDALLTEHPISGAITATARQRVIAILRIVSPEIFQ